MLLNSKVLVFDGSSLMFRALAKMPALSTYKGIRTEVIYNFIVVFRKFVKKYKPEYIVVVWEGKNNKRVVFNDSYKKKRREKRKENYSELEVYFKQVNELKEWLPKLNVNSIEVEGYEADDVIVCLAKKFRDKTVVVSYDSDLVCVVKYGAKCVSPDKGEIKVIKKGDIEIKPQDVFLYKAVVGDRSDEVTGVKGLGDSFWKSVYGKLIELGDFKKKVKFLKNEILKKKGKEGLRQFVESYKLVRMPFGGDFSIVDNVKIKRFRIDREKFVEFMYEYDINSIKVEDLF